VQTLDTDAGDRVVTVGADGGFLGGAAADLVGHSYRYALKAAAERFGPLVLVSDEVVYPDGAERFLLFDGPDGQTRVHAVTVVEDAGATTHAAVVEEFPDPSTPGQSVTPGTTV